MQLPPHMSHPEEMEDIDINSPKPTAQMIPYNNGTPNMKEAKLHGSHLQ